MPKSIPFHLQEVFGASTIEESLDSTVPVVYPAPASIPVLDTAPALRDFSKSSGAADASIAEIDRIELIDQLCPIPTEAQIEADVRKFSPTPKATPGLEKIMAGLKNIMQAALPTNRVLEEWTPAAQAMVADLIKSAYPSRQSEHKVCKLRYTLHDGVVSCCPLDLGNNLYKDQKTGRVFDFIKECAAIEHCKNHCEVSG
jgi:hypothetical protein